MSREDLALGVSTVFIAAGAIAWATSTTQTGPSLAFVGALMVALIAAYTAGRRQKRDLAASETRQHENAGGGAGTIRGRVQP